jgi:hypothetical protein
MRKPIRPTDRLAQLRQPRRLMRAVPAAAAPLSASQTGHASAGWSLPHRSQRAVVAKDADWGIDGNCKRSPGRRETCRASIDDWVRPEPATPPAVARTTHPWSMSLRYQVLDTTAAATKRRQGHRPWHRGQLFKNEMLEDEVGVRQHRH